MNPLMDKHAKSLYCFILIRESSNLQFLGKLNIGEMLREMLRSRSGSRLDGAKNLREAIGYADSVHDYVSRDMMIEILLMKKAISTGWKRNLI